MSLIILLGFSVFVSNFVLSCAAISKVRRNARDYVVTENDFRRAVVYATTNYFNDVLRPMLATTNAPVNKSISENDVDVFLLEGLCIYYSYKYQCWVARYRGGDYYQGDFFEDGLIVRLVQGRLYCRTQKGLRVYRPADGVGVSRGPAPPRDDDARL